jgi:hypothetical protein
MIMEFSVSAISAAAPIREIDIHDGEYFVRFFQPDGGFYATITAADYDDAKRMAEDGAQSVTDLVRKEGE